VSEDPPPRLRELILEKTEGNPFFMEEVVRALIDTRVLMRQPGTASWRLTAPVDQIAIPDTIQGVIMARVDRLEEDVKQVLKLAAVIGRSFFYRVLRAISEAERELDGHLTELQDLELIRERRRVPELEYIFKHALVQEATYGSILQDRRRQLHRRAGACIEALFADRLEEFYGLLAYHYARAEDWQKAQAYLFKAGDQAGRIAADAEALAHYRQAMDAYARAFGDRWEPVERASLERKIGEALFRQGDRNRAGEYLQQALAYLEAPYPTSRWGIRLGIARELLRQVWHRVPACSVPAVNRAGPVAEERSRLYLLMGWIDYEADPERLVLDTLTLLNFSERRGVPDGIAAGYMGVGLICDLIPLFGLASSYHKRAVALAENLQRPATRGLAYLGLAFHEHLVGDSDAAVGHYRQAASAYRQAGDLRGWGVASLNIAHVYLSRGQFALAQEQSQELIRTGQDGADASLRAYGLWLKGTAEDHTGRLDAAVASLEAAAELHRKIPEYRSLVASTGSLGRCYLRQGQLQRALAVLEEGDRLIAARRFRGSPPCNYLRTPWAEAYLLAAERAGEAERRDALKEARRACHLALKQGQVFVSGLPSAMRLRGTWEWLRGQPATALRWWQRSLASAEKLGARCDLGMTHLEIGRRTEDRAHLERAEAIFVEIGAQLDLAQARELLGR